MPSGAGPSRLRPDAEGAGAAMAAQAPKSIPRLILRAGVSLALIAAAFAFIAIGLGPDDIGPALAAISGETFLLLVGLSTFNYLARATRWLLLFRFVDRRGPGTEAADVPLQALVYIGGFAFTLTPGRAGEAIRVWMAKRSFGTPADAGLSLVVADRFFDAVALTVILLIAGAALSRDLVAPLILALVLGTSIVALGTLSSTRLLGAKLERRMPWLAGAVSLARGTLGHLSAVTRPRRLPLFTLPSVAGWFVQGMAPAFILNDLGVSLSLMETVFIFGFATLVGGISFLPGGLGGFEVTMVALLSAMGVPASTALIATLAMRLTTLWFGVLLGVTALVAWLVVQGRRDR